MKKVQWNDDEEEVLTPRNSVQIASPRSLNHNNDKVPLKDKNGQKKAKIYTQKNCDDKLTPIVKLLHPKCLLCGQDTQVAHHFIKKSNSSNLRYDLKNLINLCNPCHFRLHFNDEAMWNGKIAIIKGKKWFTYIEKNKKLHTPQKYDYNLIYASLEKKLQELKNRY